MILSILLNIIYISAMIFCAFMAVGFGGPIGGGLAMLFLFVITFPRMKLISRALW
jgi:hypothetical protein